MPDKIFNIFVAAATYICMNQRLLQYVNFVQGSRKSSFNNIFVEQQQQQQQQQQHQQHLRRAAVVVVQFLSDSSEC